MKLKLSWGMCLLLLFKIANLQLCSAAVNVMNYGADGNDYYQFTTPSMAFDKASGFTTLITFGIHVNADGTLMIGGGSCASNGVYTGPTNWGSLVTTLKTPPTTVTRYEVLIGGWEDTSFDNIKSLIGSQGTNTTSILYKNFQALKNAVPGIDAINDDDELTYDLTSSTRFATMLGGLGYKFTMVPYENQSFWVSLKNSITNCDYVYVQCYEGGAGNNPGQWASAFGHTVPVVPGQESNTATTANWKTWHSETGVQGGFYYPDVVFGSTYWSAAIIEANGAVPTPPTNVVAVAGAAQVSLSWNTVPGAISYTIRRSTTSGAETNFTSISTVNNNWPASNEYIDSGLAYGTTYFYEVLAVNTNGSSFSSAEVSATPLPSILLDDGFESPGIGSGNYQYNATGSSWTFSGASPNGSGLIANGSGFGNPNAPEGTQAAFVQADGAMFQSVSGFIPGTNYTVTFYAAERGGNAQTWNVTMSGTVIASFNPGSSATSYVPYSANFTATAATEILSFVGTDLAGGDNTIFIDDVQVAVTTVPANPIVAINTSPVTAADVVGSELSFTAAFEASSPMSYQWRKISAGTTNNIAGATNTTLILPNLQLTNTGSYQMQASNVSGVAVSAPGSLTVSTAPSPVNNIITLRAAQTGNGAGVFTPGWGVANSGSLIAGESPSFSSGNFSEEVSGRSVNSLTAGGSLGIYSIEGVNGGTTCLNYVTCGNGTGPDGSAAGTTLVYNLTGSTNGYNLTNIIVYGGWKDGGRDQQAYTIYYATIASPSNFVALNAVNFNPTDTANGPSATRVTLSPASGALATNVIAVKFNFASPVSENGYCGYGQIAIFGAPTIPPALPASMAATAVGTNGFAINFGDLVPGRNYVLESTTDLSSGQWSDETNFVATQTSTTWTNSTTAFAQKFYRLVGY